jgi:hypothetical protein
MCDLSDRQVFLIAVMARDGGRPATLLNTIDASHRPWYRPPSIVPADDP